MLKSEGAMAPRLASLTVIILGNAGITLYFSPDAPSDFAACGFRRRIERYLSNTSEQHELARTK